jgi:hypothetical protein
MSTTITDEEVDSLASLLTGDQSTEPQPEVQIEPAQEPAKEPTQTDTSVEEPTLASPASLAEPTQEPTLAQEPQISKEEYETLKQELEQLKNAPQPKPIDLDWVKSEEGQLYLRDVDKITVEDTWDDLLVEKMMKDKGFDQKDALDEVRDLYSAMYEEDPDTDSSEYRRAERNIKAEAKGYLEELRTRKESLQIPEINQNGNEEQIAKAKEEQLKQAEAQRQEIIKQRGQIADGLITPRKTSKIQIGDTEIEYNLSNEVAEKIKSDLADIDNLGSQFVNKDGSINEQDLFEFLAFKNDKQTFFKAYSDKRVALGNKEFIEKNIKNTNYNDKVKTTAPTVITEDDPHYNEVMALRGGE